MHGAGLAHAAAVAAAGEPQPARVPQAGHRLPDARARAAVVGA
jgi:hypothetical protein